MRTDWLAARAGIEATNNPAIAVALASFPSLSDATDEADYQRIRALRLAALDQVTEPPEEQDRREEALHLACEQEGGVIEQIAAIAARTLAGLGFKVEVSIVDEHMFPELIVSIMADVAAFAAAHPTVRL